MGINLIKDMQDIYIESYKCYWEELKTTKWMDEYTVFMDWKA